MNLYISILCGVLAIVGVIWLMHVSLRWDLGMLKFDNENGHAESCLPNDDNAVNVKRVGMRIYFDDNDHKYCVFEGTLLSNGVITDSPYATAIRWLDSQKFIHLNRNESRPVQRITKVTFEEVPHYVRWVKS